MRTKDKGKMCPYCEGTVPIDALECKYCGSSFARKATTSAYQTEDSLASLYEPPYAPTRKKPSYGIPEQEATSAPTMHDPMADYEDEPTVAIPRSPPRPAKAPRKAPGRQRATKNKEEDNQEEIESMQIGSLLLLSLGGHLFTLAWLLFFFSDHGKLVLEWKSRYWFIYLLISLPLLYKGWKKLSEEET